MKVKSLYTCIECGYQSPKWVGKCPECESWNSFEEKKVEAVAGRTHRSVEPKKIESLIVATDSAGSSFSEKRFKLSSDEINRVLGGGLVEGSLTLLTGEPGIGKSTLVLQMCDQIATLGKNVLYISGEESRHQIAGRAQRLGIKSEAISFLAETGLEEILATIKDVKPDFVVVDSIQVIHSSDVQSIAGSITQIRYATEGLMEYAKTANVPVMLIGHVTKDGTLAGPRVLEHLVDTVLYLEGDRFHHFRILRSQKNRFGSTNEVGIFEMAGDGLREVANPSAQFLEGRSENPIGSAITVTLEGTRPLLVEVQALSNVSPFGYPKRTATGFDVNRMQLLISVLQKYAGMNLANQDIFVNVVGGMRLNDPACDLAVLIAIASSFLKKPIAADAVFLGEIGLSGEIRAVTQAEKRIKEAEKLGFKKVVSPAKFKGVIEAVKAI